MTTQTAPVDLLVRSAADGDQAAWNALVDRYAALVWSVAMRFRLSEADAKDVSQTVWLRAVEHLATLREPAAFPGWLATTTRRECLKVCAPANRRAWSLDDMVLEPAADEESSAVDAQLLAAERRAAVREAFARLPAHCQRLLRLLMYADATPYAEISTQLGIPQGSIGPTRSRCLGKLRDCPVLVDWVGGSHLQAQGG